MPLGIGRIGTMQAFQPMQPFMGKIAEAKSLETEEELIKKWSKIVGEARALEAVNIWRVTVEQRTLIELLGEAWAKKRGLDYRVQVDLVYAKPDLVVMGKVPVPETDGELGALVIRLQGDYWHNRPNALSRDPLQKDRLLKGTVHGQRIMQVADVWERRVYISEDVLDAALRGEEMGQ